MAVGNVMMRMAVLPCHDVGRRCCMRARARERMRQNKSARVCFSGRICASVCMSMNMHCVCVLCVCVCLFENQKRVSARLLGARAVSRRPDSLLPVSQASKTTRFSSLITTITGSSNSSIPQVSKHRPRIRGGRWGRVDHLIIYFE